jgi:hypothetical protein
MENRVFQGMLVSNGAGVTRERTNLYEEVVYNSIIIKEIKSWKVK